MLPPRKAVPWIVGITVLRGFHSLADVVFRFRTLVCHKPKARFATDDYLVVIIANITVYRLARLMRIIAIYAGWTSHSIWEMPIESLRGIAVCDLGTVGNLAEAVLRFWVRALDG